MVPQFHYHIPPEPWFQTGQAPSALSWSQEESCLVGQFGLNPLEIIKKKSLLLKGDCNMNQRQCLHQLFHLLHWRISPQVQRAAWSPPALRFQFVGKERLHPEGETCNLLVNPHYCVVSQYKIEIVTLIDNIKRAFIGDRWTNAEILLEHFASNDFAKNCSISH